MDDSAPQFKHYADQYNANLLIPTARTDYRKNINHPDPLPFQGSDNLLAFDITWLGNDKVPQYATMNIQIPCNTPNTIDTKSLLEYLYSLVNTKFASSAVVVKTIQQDLSKVTGGLVQIELNPDELLHVSAHFPGINLDNLDVACNIFTPSIDLLRLATNDVVIETLCSDLLLIKTETQEQMTASISINYEGPQIDHNSLLQYLVSYAQYEGHPIEATEHIFCDIFKSCKPKTLSIEAKVTRRTQVAPTIIRSNTQYKPTALRLFRQ